MKMEEGTYASSPFLDCPNSNYRYYVKNKHREIYERQNPDDIFNYGKHAPEQYVPSDAESEQRQHNNNNRKSRMREDNQAGRHPEALTSGDEHTSLPDSVLQLLDSGNSGGNSEDDSLGLSEETRRIIERTRQLYAEIDRELNANLERRLSDPEFRTAVFQDLTRDGFSPTELVPGATNETVSMPGVWGTRIVADDRGNQYTLWHGLPVEEENIPW